LLIAALDARDGDTDIEDIDEREPDDPADPSYPEAYGAGKRIMVGQADLAREDDEQDDPLEANGDEEDGNRDEDDFVRHAANGPGCPIADPDVSVDDGDHSSGDRSYEEWHTLPGARRRAGHVTGKTGDGWAIDEDVEHDDNDSCAAADDDPSRLPSIAYGDGKPGDRDDDEPSLSWPLERYEVQSHPSSRDDVDLEEGAERLRPGVFGIDQTKLLVGEEGRPVTRRLLPGEVGYRATRRRP